MKFFLLLGLLISSFSVSADALVIKDAWIKNLPPGIPMRAGYMVLENNSEKSLIIVAIESEVFTQVDMHETYEKDGMMSMRPLASLTIAAGTTVELAPGGIHLMMMQPQKTLKPGDRAAITLQFDDASTQSLQMIVKK